MCGTYFIIYHMNQQVRFLSLESLGGAKSPPNFRPNLFSMVVMNLIIVRDGFLVEGKPFMD